MNQKYSLRDRILNGEVVYGTFFKICSPDVVEMLGIAGFDFIIIDTEHGNFSPVDVANMVRVCENAGISAIVRVHMAIAEDVLHALDSGADGVQIPSITNMDVAQQVCTSTKYYPEGNRGLSLTQRAAMYGKWNKDMSYYDYSNSKTLVAVHVENCAMAEKVEELCKIPQIDVIFVGPGDLSQSLGKPGQLNDPEVVALIENIFQKVLSSGKKVGIFCGNPAAVKKYVDMGATYIAYSGDTTMFLNGLIEARKAIQQ